jgi:hypothetical protein
MVRLPHPILSIFHSTCTGVEGNGVIRGHPTFRPLSRNRKQNRKQNPENLKIGKNGENLKIPGKSENPGKIRKYKNMPPID